MGRDWLRSYHRIFHSIFNIHFHNYDVLYNFTVLILSRDNMESCPRPGLAGDLEEFSDLMICCMDLQYLMKYIKIKMEDRLSLGAQVEL